MAPKIDQAALDAASAGPNPPPAGRLRAAADYVMDRTYAGRAGYGSQYQENPEELYKAFRPTAEDLLQTASTRVPELLAAHADRKKTERGMSARRGRPASVCD